MQSSPLGDAARYRPFSPGFWGCFMDNAVATTTTGMALLPDQVSSVSGAFDDLKDGEVRERGDDDDDETHRGSGGDGLVCPWSSVQWFDRLPDNVLLAVLTALRRDDLMAVRRVDGRLRWLAEVALSRKPPRPWASYILEEVTRRVCRNEPRLPAPPSCRILERPSVLIRFVSRYPLVSLRSRGDDDVSSPWAPTVLKVRLFDQIFPLGARRFLTRALEEAEEEGQDDNDDDDDDDDEADVKEDDDEDDDDYDDYDDDDEQGQRDHREDPEREQPRRHRRRRRRRLSDRGGEEGWQCQLHHVVSGLSGDQPIGSGGLDCGVEGQIVGSREVALLGFDLPGAGFYALHFGRRSRLRALTRRLRDTVLDVEEKEEKEERERTRRIKLVVVFCFKTDVDGDLDELRIAIGRDAHLVLLPISADASGRVAENVALVVTGDDTVAVSRRHCDQHLDNLDNSPIRPHYCRTRDGERICFAPPSVSAAADDNASLPVFALVFRTLPRLHLFWLPCPSVGLEVASVNVVEGLCPCGHAMSAFYEGVTVYLCHSKRAKT